MKIESARYLLTASAIFDKKTKTMSVYRLGAIEETLFGSTKTLVVESGG